MRADGVGSSAGPWTPSLANVRRLAGSDGLLILILAVEVFGLLVIGTAAVLPDPWLTVVAGREVARHGLPSFEHLTVLAQGRRWVDQQWLAQLFFYGLYEAGGMRLIVLVTGAVAGGAAAAAAVVARTRASARATVWVALVAVLPFMRAAAVPRAQTLVLPLFVALVWLLVSDSRAPSRRVFWIVALLAPWANLHGSVLVAAGLVSAHAILCAGRSAWSRVALVVVAWACVLASPYAAHLPQYYRTTAFNSAFAKYVSEWLPTTLSPLNIPFYVLAGAAVYLLGRVPAGYTRTEKALLLLTLVAALLALRNVLWFTIVATMLLPAALDVVLPVRTWPSRLNVLAAAGGAALLLVAVLVAVTRSPVGAPPASAERAVLAAAGRDGLVFADSRYADWLLAAAPQLRGRVAFDSRFELLPKGAVEDIYFLRRKAVGWPRYAARYRVFFLERRHDDDLVDVLRAHGYELRYRHGKLLVLARGPRSR